MLVARSGLFDRDWYVKRYPDVAAAHVNPLRHFVHYGSREGRSPSPKFDAIWYLRNYADVRIAGAEPLFHYLKFGRAEGRQPTSDPAELSRVDKLEKDSTQIVAEYWAVDRSSGRPISWDEHKVLLEFMHRRVTGDPNVTTYEWFKRKFFQKPAELCLSIGCGFGAFEKGAIELGIAKRFHAYDISSGAIERAKQGAAQAGVADRIAYDVLNINEIVLPANTYDAIFAISSAHHIFNLENLFRQCQGALKPGGLLFLDEYIGPSRFQSSPEVTEIINKVLSILPPRYRKSQFANNGTTIDRYVPSPVEHFEQHDPSEAIRSAEIVSTLRLYFDIVEFRPYGGTILHMLLSGITGNFDETKDSDVALLNLLATFEEILENAGVIEADFAAIVAKPKA